MQVKGFCLQVQCPHFRNTIFPPESFMMSSECYDFPQTPQIYPSRKIGVKILMQLFSMLMLLKGSRIGILNCKLHCNKLLQIMWYVEIVLQQ